VVSGQVVDEVCAAVGVALATLADQQQGRGAADLVMMVAPGTGRVPILAGEVLVMASP